ncbi:DUF4124 domain-containing protein [Alishewanella sp. d11]|uniref:DUF4124 domain-containing protein n=1 Tax=Alishewanella sp. d11 TaxID=3414030 RepID=UPI003BF7D1D9
MDRTMAKARLIFIYFICLVCSNALLAHPVYRWQDEKGVTHFSQYPPAAGQYQIITIRSNNPASTPVSQSDTDDQLDPKLCLQAQEQLTLLNSEQDLYTQDAATKTLRLVTQDEREQQKLLATFEIKRRCTTTP